MTTQDAKIFQYGLSFTEKFAQNEALLNFIKTTLLRKGLIVNQQIESISNRHVFFEITATFEAMCHAATILRIKKKVKTFF